MNEHIINAVLKEMPSSFTRDEAIFFLTAPNSYLDGKKPIELAEKLLSLAYAFGHPADAF